MRNREIETHESYGMLGISRISYGGSTDLFGSSIKHGHTIQLTIKRAEKHRHLHKYWYHRRETLIKVEMSQTQFAEVISTLNIGDGVPVTLRQVKNGNMEEMEDCPEKSVRKVFDKELKKDFKSISSRLDDVVDLAKSYHVKKSTTKAERETLWGKLVSIRQSLGENLPFLKRSFTESMNKTVVEAKGEIDAALQNVIVTLGKEKAHELFSESAAKMITSKKARKINKEET